MQSSFIVATIMVCIYRRLYDQATHPASRNIHYSWLACLCCYCCCCSCYSSAFTSMSSPLARSGPGAANQNRNVLHAGMYAHEPYRTLQHPFHTRTRGKEYHVFLQETKNHTHPQNAQPGLRWLTLSSKSFSKASSLL